ncbi:MAG: DUF898 domain-containing protein [Burkholderiales bacterium]|nr:DUF898 domain-containing protein [Burkholderiales bacterium]
MPTAPAALAPAADPPPRDRAVALRFTGSGSEYFRIWIVNLLLTLLTLGLYYPFAKARRLRYFHANTLVDDQPLGFHGDAWKMLRGFLLIAVFALLYGAAGRFSPVTAAVAAVLFAALWPALWQSSLRFRLANTSWRGLRLRFSGNLADAYRAMLPALLPVLGLVTFGALRIESAWLPGLLGLAMLGLSPWMAARVKRYQHDHYGYAGEASRFEASTASFYGLWLRFGALMFGLGALTGLVAALVMPVLVRGQVGGGRAGPSAAAVGAIVLLLVFFYGLLFTVAQPYFTSRLQNLVWDGTRSQHLRFQSRLGARALARLTLKNLLLMIVTLGFYRPFAAVATARLRLEAVTLLVRGDIAQWSQALAGASNDAAGDAAGDLLGIDIGL